MLSTTTDRMDIYIEEYRHIILIREKWKYNWLNDAGTSLWTYMEKKAFHHRVDNLIWGNLGSFFCLKAFGISNFAKRHKNTHWTVNFDIQWVLSNEHWSVFVHKINSGKFKQSNIVWDKRVINIDTEDTVKIIREHSGKKYMQYPVLHEFGHTFGNSIFAATGMHGDEYKNTSQYFADKKSLMNIGNELRNRHLDFILSELNTMMPDVTFKHC